jgi:threonine dehydrogenase-like Zn-dependent dehydrogenase
VPWRLAVAAGLTVATTAGMQNHGYVKSLGATYTFDHKEKNIVDEILKVIDRGDLVFDCIGDATTQKTCAQILSQIGGGTLACLTWPLPNEYKNVEVKVGMLSNGIFFSTCLIMNTVNGLDPGLVDLDIGDAVWRKYIPKALASGKFQAKPDPEVLKGGLGRVQDGIDILRKGVSAKKIVIEIANA